MSQENVINFVCGVLRIEEGFSDKPYYCSAGYPTIGHGLKIGPYNAGLDQYVFRVNKVAAQALLEQHVLRIWYSIRSASYMKYADEARQAIFLSMIYQMGHKGFLKFVNMIAAAENDNWRTVSIEALDSKWAKNDSKQRANRHAYILSTGCLDAVYRLRESENDNEFIR